MRNYLLSASELRFLMKPYSSRNAIYIYIECWRGQLPSVGSDSWQPITNVLFGSVQIWTGDDACPHDLRRESNR